MDVFHPSIAILIIIVLINLTASEIFTSTYQLTELLNVEYVLDEALSTYIQEESKRLDTLRQYAYRWRNISRKDIIDHLSATPVGIFTSSRRFYNALNVVESAVRQRDHREGFLKRLQDRQKNNISNTDLEGANEALLRLQVVYDISPRAFTNGHIVNYSVDRPFTSEQIDNNSRSLRCPQNKIDKHSDTCSTIQENHVVKQSDNAFRAHEKIDNHSAIDQTFTEDISSLLRHGYHGYEGITAIDNFRIGRQAYNTGKRKLAKLWMENVLHMLGTRNEVYDITGKATRKEVLDHLGYLEYKFANYNKSLEYYEEMLRYDPNDLVLQSNIVIMKQMVTKNEVGSPISDDDEEYDEMMLTYMNQCRQANDVTSSPSNDPRLTCRYENKHPLTRIKPVAMETIGIDPRIEVFRGILSDREIDELLTMAQPKLLRAAVNNDDTGGIEVADFRISKTAWLNRESDIVKTLERRVAAITGLTTDTAEYLQINNYGLGGQYEPHFDHAYDMSQLAFPEMGVGNRIATLMFYLSDVEAGGATAFIRTGVNAKPSKGDAVFWYNLKRSGEGDDRTLHAGCPVLVGNKWVANKWFHEYGNEFLRPCGLTQDE